MCGRYTLSKIDQLRERFRIDTSGFELQPCYNVCPDEVMPVISATGPRGQRQLELMQWGLIPFWSKQAKSIAINARIEEILKKPSFRKPIRSQRCLVPASGFYEWKKEPGGKIPFYIRPPGGGLFAFAGLYDSWKDAEGTETRSYAILTTAADPFKARVHDRMPVILSRDQEDAWLATEAAHTENLLESVRAGRGNTLEMYPVSKRVNWAKNDGPELIKPVEVHQS